MSEKILLVDDEPNLLESFVRQLRRQFDLAVTTKPARALEMIRDEPFAVVVADYRMPVMDGIELLAKIRVLSPKTVRIMLTGNADQGLAVEAINNGRIFRFLNKPCSTENLIAALNDAIAQYRLATAETELLERTLTGVVKLLTDLLSFVSPETFNFAIKVRDAVRELGRSLEQTVRWELELAALLSPIGFVTLPAHILEKLNADDPLSAEEADLIARMPEIGSSLLANIPRLERISNIVRYQDKRFDGGGQPQDAISGNAIPVGARMLKLCKDAVRISSPERTLAEAIDIVRQREGWYDPVILELARNQFPEKESKSVEAANSRHSSVRDLVSGEVILCDIETVHGLLVVTAGRVISPALLERLKNYHSTVGLKEPIMITASPPPVDFGRAKFTPMVRFLTFSDGVVACCPSLLVIYSCIRLLSCPALPKGCAASCVCFPERGRILQRFRKWFSARCRLRWECCFTPMFEGLFPQRKMSTLRKLFAAFAALLCLSVVAPANTAASFTADDAPTSRTYSAESFVAAYGSMLVFQTPRGLDFVSMSDLSLTGNAIAVKHVDLTTVMPKFLGQSVSLVTGPLVDHGRLLFLATSSLEEAKAESSTAVVEDQKFTTSYHDKEGFEHKVETPRRPRESVRDWVERHQEALAAYRTAFPPA